GEDVLQRLQALAEHFRTGNSSQSPTLPPPDPAAAQLTNRAAVLICLFLSDIGELRVILTKRASTLSSHSGEVALPGGKRDLSDADDVATALREAEEEIGLAPSLVNVVAVLEPYVNKVHIYLFVFTLVLRLCLSMNHIHCTIHTSFLFILLTLFLS
ncbi:Nudix hydrolase 11, partial [Cucurbita argyrosperma subsp. argyrosperma]